MHKIEDLSQVDFYIFEIRHLLNLLQIFIYNLMELMKRVASGVDDDNLLQTLQNTSCESEFCDQILV
jgi:hypothetical protein